MVKEQELEIKEIIQRTYNVKSFRLRLGSLADFQAGQFMLVKLKSDKELKRFLSISNSPTEQGYLEFTKKITDSDFSGVLKGLKVSDRIIVQYPLGKFILDEQSRKVAFISGGIGITPIRSMCKYVVDKNLGTDIILLYANRTPNDISFRVDFEQMQKQYPKLQVIHVLCEHSAGIECKIGSIDKNIIKESILDYPERKFYICGPPVMVSDIKKILTDGLAVPVDNIITESFQGY